MIRGYSLGVSSRSCIHTYVVGYSFITVVHILQHNITRYNIYNPHREKLEERGSFWWSILLIFSLQYYIVFGRSQQKYIFFVSQTIIGRRWKVRLSPFTLVCALIILMCTHNMAKQNIWNWMTLLMWNAVVTNCDESNGCLEFSNVQ